MAPRFAGRWKPRALLDKSIGLAPGNGIVFHKAPVGYRQQINKQEKLMEFQRAQQDGKAFIPIKDQPPWRKGPTELDRSMKRNYAGLKVALVDQDDEPGFPTHFR